MVLASSSLGVAALWLQGLGPWGRGACKTEAQKESRKCESTHVAFVGTASRNMWSGSRYSVPHQQRLSQRPLMSEHEIVKRVLGTFFGTAPALTGTCVLQACNLGIFEAEIGLPLTLYRGVLGQYRLICCKIKKRITSQNDMADNKTRIPVVWTPRRRIALVVLLRYCKQSLPIALDLSICEWTGWLSRYDDYLLLGTHLVMIVSR